MNNFIDDGISPWMREEGPDNDIVLSSRVRLARNFAKHTFPTLADEAVLKEIHLFFKEEYENKKFQDFGKLSFLSINDLTDIEKNILVEKHLISPFLADKAKKGAALISQNEQISIMINEEDHVRIQMYCQGLQLNKALQEAFNLDDWLEEKIDYAFDENKGYLTSCPTNVGTGMRASVMMHLPALVFTKQISQMLPTINQLGFVVRGIYGEGSEAMGNIFQISNQITLGKSEEKIISDLQSIVIQLIEQEKMARKHLIENLAVKLENQIFRSYAVLKYSRIIESKEAATCLSNVRLGIDLGIIEDTSKTILHELMVLTQPGFLQQYAKKILTTNERDILRASLIRERLQ